MEEVLQKEDWIIKYQNNFLRYCGRLTLYYGLNINDVGVYILLITKKWLKDDKKQFSPYDIFKKLNTIPSDFVENQYKTNFTERSVPESLSKLESLGFVKKHSNPTKINEGGRPPKAFYEACDIDDLKNYTQSRLDDRRTKMLDLLDELLNIEENLGFGVNTRSDENVR